MKALPKKVAITALAFLIVGLGLAFLMNQQEPKAPVQEVSIQEPVQNAELQSKREAQAQKLAQLAKERGGFPIDQALGQAASERHREFIKKDMAYQRQTPDESRMIALDRLSEVEGKLAKADDPKQIAMLEKQVEMLRQIVERLE